MAEPELQRETHRGMLRAALWRFPGHYAALDPNRVTLLFFVCGGMRILDEEPAHEAIAWLYGQQVGGGFANGPSLRGTELHEPHLAMTYSALSTLLMLGDDLKQVYRQGILDALPLFQRPDGAVHCLTRDSDHDMRFLFCLCAVADILGDWSTVQKQPMIDYIRRSQAFDGGFGMGPGQEGHGGSTYCAVAALALMGDLDAIPHRGRLVQWCLQQQGAGFRGRTNKSPDCCYTFWIGATLTLLGCYRFTATSANCAFTLTCQDPAGGFAKHPGLYPDIMHTYLALAGLALDPTAELAPVSPRTNRPRTPNGSQDRAQGVRASARDGQRPTGTRATVGGAAGAVGPRDRGRDSGGPDYEHARSTAS